MGRRGRAIYIRDARYVLRARHRPDVPRLPVEGVFDIPDALRNALHGILLRSLGHAAEEEQAVQRQVPHSLKQRRVRGHVVGVIDPEHVAGHQTGVPQHVAAVVVVAPETMAQLLVLAQEVDIVHRDVRIGADGQVVHPTVYAQSSVRQRARELGEDVVRDVGGAEELLLRGGVETVRTAAGIAEEDIVEGDEAAVDLEIGDFGRFGGDGGGAVEEGKRWWAGSGGGGEVAVSGSAGSAGRADGGGGLRGGKHPPQRALWNQAQK